MTHRSRSLLVVAGLLAPVVLGGPASARGPAQQPSAISQDLVVSAVAGGPGDVFTVSSASCESGEESFESLTVVLLSGVAPDQVLAAAGSADDDGVVKLVVPDWVDPSAPAVLQASCIDFSADDPTPEPYDPLAFDITPGAGPVTQTSALDRSSVLVGQGFTTTGTGCDLSGAEGSGTAVFAADDHEFIFAVTGGDGEVDGTDVSMQTLLANSGFVIGGGGSGDDLVLDTAQELPTDLAPGSYTVEPYCFSDEALLLLPPQALEVSGRAPIAEIDLTATRGSRSVTVAGEGCTDGPVELDLEAESSADFFDEAPFVTRRPGSGDVVPGGWSRGPRREASSPTLVATFGSAVHRRGAGRTLAEDDFDTTSATPDANGSWSHTDQVGFDDGYVAAFGICGDPFGDGFVYDAQVAIVKSLPVAPPTTTTTAPPVTPPPPAEALPGNATFAG